MAAPLFQNEDDSEREEAVEKAWRLAIDALTNGFFVLDNGLKVPLTNKDIIRHVQWMATVGKVKPKGFPIPKDLFVKATRGAKDDKEE